jgi:hypothetical protein
MRNFFLWVGVGLLLPLGLWAQVPPPPPATPDQVTAGTSRAHFVSPWALATAGVSSNGLTAAGVTNVINGMRVNSAFSIGGNAATAALATNVVGTVSPYMFGGAGDGTTDDTLAVSNCIVAVNNGRANIISLAARPWKITQPLPWFGRSISEVRDGALLTERDDMALLPFNQSGPYSTQSVQSVTFRNLHLGRIGTNAPTEASVGLLIGTNYGTYGYHNALAENCRITNFHRGIAIYAVPQVRIVNCGIGNIWSNAVYVGYSANNPDYIEITQMDWNQSDFGTHQADAITEGSLRDVQRTNTILFQSECISQTSYVFNQINGGGAKQVIVVRGGGSANVDMRNIQSEGLYTGDTNICPYEFTNCTVVAYNINTVTGGLFGNSNYTALIGLYGNTAMEKCRFGSPGVSGSWSFDLYGTPSGYAAIPNFDGAATVKKHATWRDTGTVYRYAAGYNAFLETPGLSVTAIPTNGTTIFRGQQSALTMHHTGNHADFGGDVRLTTADATVYSPVFRGRNFISTNEVVGAPDTTTMRLSLYGGNNDYWMGVEAFYIWMRTYGFKIYKPDNTLVATIGDTLNNTNVFAHGLYSPQFRTAQNTPASASAAGTVGEIRVDANYIYICTAADTWKRVAIATW